MTFKYYQISKKSAYAVEALLELAVLETTGPVNVRKLAKSRRIPLRFLEVILNELKQGGFIRSIRGKTGGYLLAESPKIIKISRILLFLEKVPSPNSPTDSKGSVALNGLLTDVNEAIGDFFENTSLQDLIDEEIKSKENYVANYTI